jgi:predicted AAA+ superfamily ATPase
MKLTRTLYKDLLSWKNNPERMPLMLMGARQVGKTFLVNQFGKSEYRNIHTFNFQESPDLCSIFDGVLKPEQLLDELAVYQRKDIHSKNDLVFFDEVQDCDRAITSLKYFQEKLPSLHIIAAGSLLGVKLGFASFPVGKVEMLHLYPLSFEEFLLATKDEFVLRLFTETSRLKSAHTLLWEYLQQYFFVGGMPKAVGAWFKSSGINSRIVSVRKIQKDLLAGYERDISKHSGRINALHITTLFENIPRQLSLVFDGSIKRFRFKGVLAGKRTYTQLQSTISWLENAGLIFKIFPVEGKPRIPLKAFSKENIFKLLVFDVGILGAMLDLSYKDLMDQDYGITKGYFAENFVACEFVKAGRSPLYSWQMRNAEIEFLYVTADSEIIPVEVKSGKRTKAKSLASYIERYNPAHTVKLVGKVGGTDKKYRVLPLYYAGLLR